MSKVTSPRETVEDGFMVSLRPRTLEEYVGQEKIKKRLIVAMEAARMRGEPLDHILLAGPPGLGKTTLAHIIANEMNARIHVTSGPIIERQGDLAAIVTSLDFQDVLFIDEVHRLSKVVEEILYAAMEDFKLDIMIGKGPSARSIRIDVEPFTLVAATTRSGLISAPLRNRFGMVFELDFYSEEEIKEIVERTARKLGIEIVEEAASYVAQRSRGTPRIANRLVKRIRDVATIKKTNVITLAIARETMKMLEIDDHGLDSVDRKILKVIIETFNGGPVGIKALAASMGMEPDTISEVYEPYLLQAGFIARTHRGRVVTEKAWKHMGYSKAVGPLWDEDG
ncbi:MAG: Holliday junction branch migration DNA helicase RuvB [Thermotogae bacterium]|nr:MAG: Holliday junction branch migration DNA helicase RuvB [Thermotogota bacterium]